MQPDPLHPQIVHGGFEEPVGDDGEPRGWYYCRLMKIIKAPDAPEGSHYITFINDVPGRMSRALQGFAVDGKKIGQIEVTAMIRGRDIKPGPAPDQLPQISLTYYDDNWAIIGRNFVGPFRGSFDWQQITTISPRSGQGQQMHHAHRPVGWRWRIFGRRRLDSSNSALNSNNQRLPIICRYEILDAICCAACLTGILSARLNTGVSLPVRPTAF